MERQVYYIGDKSYRLSKCMFISENILLILLNKFGRV